MPVPLIVFGLAAILALGYFIWTSPLWKIPKQKRIVIEILDEAVESVESIGKFTGRNELSEVVCDALRTYEWILEQQAKGNEVVVESNNPDDAVGLADFITDLDLARKFFELDDSPTPTVIIPI